MSGLKMITAVPYDQHPVLSISEFAACRLPAGFRFLVNDEMEIVEPVLLFLFDRYAQGGKQWSKVVLSETAACDDLYEWWAYIGLIGIHWCDIVTDDIFGYRKALETSISPRTLQRYKANTIRRRLSTILSFYKWALAEKYTDEAVDRRRLTGAIRSLDGNVLAHVDRSIGKTEASDLLPREEEAEPNPFLNTKELKSVLQALGPLPSERQEDGRSTRDRLAATVALVTGARISEVLNVPLSEVVGLCRPQGAEPTSSLVLWLRKTKRMRPRKVLLPVWLLDELILYVDDERAEAVRRATDVGRTPGASLFLNGASANDRDVGYSLTRRTLSRSFWKAVVSVGLHTTVEADHGHGAMRRIVARHSFHDLRHTFAVQQYLARKAKGDAEPWKVISVLLGHKSWKTTMDYYLASVSITESQLSDTMTGYFRSILSLGGVANVG